MTTTIMVITTTTIMVITTTSSMKYTYEILYFYHDGIPPHVPRQKAISSTTLLEGILEDLCQPS